MILIDTNYLIDFILPPFDANAEARNQKATALMLDIEAGRVGAIIPEVVFHECFHVLVTRLNAIDVATFVDVFQSILQFHGWEFTREELEVYHRALAIVNAYPKLEFSDAVIAARAEAHNAELATFDKRLAKAYGGPIWTGE